MTLDDVPADTTLILTHELDRLFKAAGCNPACHACGNAILSYENFMLLSYEGTDEMLCHRCDREALKRKKQEDKERLELKEREEREWKKAVKLSPYNATRNSGHPSTWTKPGYSRPSRS